MTTQKPFVPELLSPAGSLKNMRYAFAYGADAVTRASHVTVFVFVTTSLTTKTYKLVSTKLMLKAKSYMLYVTFSRITLN